MSTLTMTTRRCRAGGWLLGLAPIFAGLLGLLGAGTVLLTPATPPVAAALGLDDLSKEELKERLTALGELAKKFEELDRMSSERGLILNQIGALRFPAAAKFLVDLLEKTPKNDSYTIESTVRSLAIEGSELALRTVLTTGFERLPEKRARVIGDSVKEFPDPDAVEWIVTKGWKTIPTLPPQGQDEWVRVLRATQDPRMVRAARGVIKDKRTVPATLVAMLEILEENPAPSDAKNVAKLFRSHDKRVQVGVLRALRAMGAATESKTFFKALESRHWEVRATAVDMLGATHQRELIPQLVPALEDRAIQVRLAAVQALQTLGGAEVMNPLITALEKAENGRLKDDIAEALVRLTGKDFGVGAANWQSWWTANKETAEIASISREEYDRIKDESADAATAVGIYFGLRVISDRATFIIDTSNSMSEPYLVTLRDPDKKRGEGGSTAVPGSPEDKKKNKKVKRTKIEVAREELVKVLKNLRDGTQFNIVPFSSFHKLWKPALVAMEESIRAAAVEFVEALKPGGMTNVYDTLMAALADPDVNTIYFLSDGAPTMGTILEPDKILAEVAKLNQLRKVKIHTIGFHLDPKAEDLMRKLAEQNYGRFVER